MHPKVSILLPTHNGATFLTGAIRGVLGQTFEDFELLVIDDGSTDETADIVLKFAKTDPRARLLRNERNLGIQKSLNRGLREARGIYIARIDDDDEWIDPRKLEAQTAFLDSHSDYVLVGTGIIVVDPSRNEITRYLFPETDEAIRRRMLVKNCFVHSAALFRANVARESGGYSEEEAARHVEDYDLWLRLGLKGRLANLHIHAVKFMLRPGAISVTNKMEQFRKDFVLVKRYRGKYPNYWMGVLVGLLRLWGYRLYLVLPQPLRSLILKLYKVW